MSEPYDRGALHLYPSPTWNQEGYIVGDRQGLEALRDAINRALKGEPSKAEVWISDGEGCDVVVVNLDASSEKWKRLALPYTDSDASEKGLAAIWPYELLTKEQEKALWGRE